MAKRVTRDAERESNDGEKSEMLEIQRLCGAPHFRGGELETHFCRAKGTDYAIVTPFQRAVRHRHPHTLIMKRVDGKLSSNFFPVRQSGNKDRREELLIETIRTSFVELFVSEVDTIG